ncbi:MAG: aspartate-semialdehyde dehydrogenase [Melioribacteraceae bacterium]
MNKITVGILGATGSVGQRFIELLSNHPYFEVAELGASGRSAGKKYSEAVNWIMQTPLPTEYGNLVVKECIPNFNSKIIFSGLDASVAGEIETQFAESGYFVISNARNHRFDIDVPLIIPEINYDHLELLHVQKYKGGIITNPNCSTIGLAMALKPLYDNFGLEAVNVVTMQAISGAGYPGVASLDILDNVIPYIGGEEEKLETEPTKILGKLHLSKTDSDKTNTGEIELTNFKISAQCNRVPVIDGHTESVQVKLKSKPTLEEIKKVWREFKSLPQKLNLPSAPIKPIHYYEEDNYPQAKIHRNLENGMGVAIGRLRECALFDYKFTILSHNTIRGAAGGTILIAELMQAKGYFTK